MRFICAIYGSFYDFSCILNLYDGVACVCTRDESEINTDSFFHVPHSKSTPIFAYVKQSVWLPLVIQPDGLSRVFAIQKSYIFSLIILFSKISWLECTIEWFRMKSIFFES